MIKITQLDWSKMAKVFSKITQKISLSVIRKAGEQASARPGVFLSQNFRYFPAF